MRESIENNSYYFSPGPIYAYTTKQGPNGPVIVVESVTIVGFAIGGFFIEIVHIEWIETILKLRSELVCLN